MDRFRKKQPLPGRAVGYRPLIPRAPSAASSGGQDKAEPSAGSSKGVSTFTLSSDSDSDVEVLSKASAGRSGSAKSTETLPKTTVDLLNISELSNDSFTSNVPKRKKRKAPIARTTQPQPLASVSDMSNDSFDLTFPGRGMKLTAEDRSDRLEYLLKQTELFSHFIKPIVSHESEASASEESQSKPKGGRPRKKSVKALAIKAHTVKHADREKVIPHFESSPSFIKGTEMRDYQIRGLNWLISLYENGINGILADEMGLGKTIQTISLLGYLLHYRKVQGPHLIVVPLSTIANWKIEIEKWCPSLKAVSLIGNKEERHHIYQNVLKKAKWNVCLTTYEMCLIEITMLRKFSWVYLIIDEGHRIKHESSKLSRYVRTLESANRLLLTGTPLQNNLHELWALLNMLLPEFFHSSEDFDSWFDTEDCLGDSTSVDRLHAILRPFLLRRIKADVEKSLLPKKEIKVYVGLSQLQKEWYKKVLMDEVYKMAPSGELKKKRIANVLMQLRKVVNHPYLFREAEPGPPYTTDSHIVTNCGKMVVLDKLLPKLKEEGSRVLIFSQFTTMVDILEDYLIWKDYNYCRLDGNTQQADRQVGIEEFNAKGSEKFIYLISTRAGGLGINLATADVVIIYDSDWNPQMDIQATDRCHRIGQTKQVRVFRLIAENTVDEKVVERAEVKLHLDRKVIQQGRLLDSGSNAPSAEEIQKMIQYGAESIIASKESTVTDESIDDILARSNVRSTQLAEKLGSLEESSLRNFTIDEPVPSTSVKRIDVTSFPVYSSYDFEGVDYKVLREKKKTKESKREFRAIQRAIRPRRHGGSGENELPKSPSDSDSDDKEEEDNELDAEEKDDDYVEYDLSIPTKPRHLYDFQFPSPRLVELHFRHLDLYKAFRKPPFPGMEDLAIKDAQKLERLEKERLEECKPLRKDEAFEKADLWKDSVSKKMIPARFIKYWKAVATFGFDNLEIISDVLPDVPTEDLVAYTQIFQNRCAEICDVEAIIREDKFDALLPRVLERKNLLALKMSQYEEPEKDLTVKFDPPSWQGVRFTKEQDRTLLVALSKIFADPENTTPFTKLQETLRKNLKLDGFLRTRTKEELNGRCNLLFHMIEKEFSDSHNSVKTEPQASLSNTGSPVKAINPLSETNTQVPHTSNEPKQSLKRKIYEGKEDEETPPRKKTPRMESPVSMP